MLGFQITPQRLLHDETGNGIWSINNAVLLAFAANATAFTFDGGNTLSQVGNKRFRLGFRCFAQLFQFRHALLENMTQYGNAHFCTKIVFRQAVKLLNQGIRYIQIFQCWVGRKQTTVVRWDGLGMIAAAFIDGLEQGFQIVPGRA